MSWPIMDGSSQVRLHMTYNQNGRPHLYEDYVIEMRLDGDERVVVLRVIH